jgi:subtilisin family serine protease
LEGNMSEPNDWRRNLVPKVADQVEHITAAFESDGTRIGVVTADEGIGHLHAEARLLVREEHLDRVRDILRQRADAGLVQRIAPGVVLLRLAETADGNPPAAVADALDRVDTEIGRGNATPDHVITVAGIPGACPATEPREVEPETEPVPPPRPGSDGEGVLVYVADTGLLADAATTHPWLKGVEGDLDPLPPVAKDGTQPIPPYTGHGTFVAGVIRCVAPGTDVYVGRVFKAAGSALESDLVADLDRALARGVDIFHLSISAPTRGDLPLLAFGEWLRRLRQYKGVVCTVAAGNEGSRRPSWPAALPGMIAVGALTADGRSRASFSNYGGWVDVYAPGRDHVNAYATGVYTCHEYPFKGERRHLYGMARWSGTSFSTPIVTGLIAARMSRTGENGRQAAQALLAQAREQALPGTGAVLLP